MPAPTIIPTFFQGGGVFAVGASPNAATTTALNSAFSFGVGGVGFATTFMLPKAGTLTEIYVVPTAFAGSWAATDQVINWEIREGFHATHANKPGSLVASGTLPLVSGTVNAWQGVTGLSVALQAGVQYNLLVGDADGNATNFVTLNRELRPAGPGLTMGVGSQATAGWSGNGTLANWPQTMAWVVDGVTYCTTPHRQTASRANNTLARGQRLVLAQNIPALQLVSAAVSTALGSYKLYRGAGAVPNDTPEWSWTIPASWTPGTTQSRCCIFEDGPILRPGETYFFVYKPTANNTQFGKNQGWGGMTAGIRSSMSGYLGIEIADALEVSGGAAWTIDTDATISGLSMTFMPVPQPTICG